MPELTVCRCDPNWIARAVCPTCKERNDLHRLLLARGIVRAQQGHPSASSYAALAALAARVDAVFDPAHEARLDALDSSDRAWDARP